MSPRQLLPIVLLFVAGCASTRPSSNEQGNSTRPPNIIFIMADDLGYSELGCYGQKRIRTPNIDRMAAEGIRFTDFYSAAPVCAPTRCAVVTGMHTGHGLIRDNREVQPEGQMPLPAGTVTLPGLLRQAGYRTAMVGKWGLGGPGSVGEPNRHGFDYFFGYLCQRKAHTHYPEYLWRNTEKVMLEGNVAGSPVGGHHSQDLFIAEAMQFIRESRSRPFFLYLPFIIPHVALQIPEEDLSVYDGVFPDDPPYDGRKGYLPHPRPRAAYAAMITRMDKDVGRILALLRDLGLDRDTLVIFASDNGPTHDVGGADTKFFDSAGPLNGRKGSLWEGGIRAPFVARWPGTIVPGQITHHACATYDLLATFVELAGIDAPPKTDGLSFAATLRGRGRQRAHDYLYWETVGYGGQQALRRGDWKILRQNMGKGNMRLSLYDLSADIGESRDLASEMPDRVAEMERIMSAARTPSTDFPMPGIDKPVGR